MTLDNTARQRITGHSLERLISVIDGVEDRANKQDLTEPHYTHLMTKLNFMRDIIHVLEDYDVSSQLYTTILGLLTMSTQKPKLAESMMEAFNNTMVDHLMKDLMKREGKR